MVWIGSSLLNVPCHLLITSTNLSYVCVFSRDRGMTDKLPHKTVEDLNKDIIVDKPGSLEIFLKSFSIFMPIIRYVFVLL